MHQLPVRAKRADPSNLGTADCALICHCDDGCDYAVKDHTSGAYVQHSEWFCKHLGDRVGIASPECRLVEVNGAQAYGSRWETGHDPTTWWLRVKNGEIEKDRVAPVLSRVLAFDLFVNNVDRHASNYIVREQAGGWSMLAFDHSRAWLASGWPLSAAPIPKSVVTVRNFAWFNRYLGGVLDAKQFRFVLNHLRDVPADYVEQILHYQASDWLSEMERDDIIVYWRSPHRMRRLDRIEEGLSNGEYV